MLPTHGALRARLIAVVQTKSQQGHDVTGLAEQINALPDSYDAMAEMAERLVNLPLRKDWPYVEPNALDDIWAECDPTRPTRPIRQVDPDAVAPRVRMAFLASVCGCVLGKPLEFNPDLERIRAAAEAIGQWPINDYISEKLLDKIGARHCSWVETARERIRYVAPDDDINYTLAGMLLLEQHGIAFTHKDVQNLWFHNFAPGWQWGPERTMNINAAIHSLGGSGIDAPWARWTSYLNPGDELCGALIRADAYGYACPGHPALAAELAWRDASYSHNRTGIYGTMFTAAAIAAMFVVDTPIDAFRIAAAFVPQRSRFANVVNDSLRMIEQADDWLDGYARVHNKYCEYSHCQVYQEIGTLMNTLKFARDVGEGICMQVSQGNATDSFGATAGSLLGAFHGPDKLEPRWLKPFNNRIHTTLAAFHEQDLSALADRIARLPHIGLAGVQA